MVGIGVHWKFPFGLTSLIFPISLALGYFSTMEHETMPRRQPATTTTPVAATPSHSPAVMNWANTRVLATSDRLVAPRTVEELRQVLATHSHVRPIGSRLTYEAWTAAAAPAEETDVPVLLDLRHFQGPISIDTHANRATFWSGTTIDAVSAALEKVGKYLDASPGVIGIQTMAGALATGTHGQGLLSEILPDTLVGMEIMRADGTIVKVTEQDTELLQAVRIHLGVLGIVLSVTLRIADLRILTCAKATIPLADFKDMYVDVQRREEYCKAWWFTNTNLVHFWAASEATPKEISVYQNQGNQLVNATSGLLSASHESLSSPKTEKEDPLATAIQDYEQKMEHDTRDVGRTGRQFETVVRFKNATSSVIGTMRQIYMKGIPVPQINCEIAVPLSRFREAVDLLERWVATTQHELHYPFIFRCTKASTAFLAPHRGQDVCWIGFLVYLAADGSAKPGSFEMMHDLQVLLSTIGGTPHWGKHFLPELYHWQTLYPKWQDFLHLMQEWDPKGKWQNAWTQTLLMDGKHKPSLERLTPSAASVGKQLIRYNGNGNGNTGHQHGETVAQPRTLEKNPLGQ